MSFPCLILILIVGLRNLDSLILAHNKLPKVPANVFSHLTQLNSLELEGNNIAYIDENAFAGLEGINSFVAGVDKIIM